MKSGAVWGVLAIVLFVGTGFFVGTKAQGETLAERGGVGESCYPNKTCDPALTCFKVRADLLCEKQITPVSAAGLQSCYSLNGDGGPVERCFQTATECLSNFARALGQPDVHVVAGCSP